MSKITNLMKYSLKHTFLPRRGLLPHETRISQVELIHRGDLTTLADEAGEVGKT